MGVNWLAGLHHPDGPGRRRAMPRLREAELAVVGGSCKVGARTPSSSTRSGKVDDTLQAWSRRAEQWWCGIRWPVLTWCGRYRSTNQAIAPSPGLQPEVRADGASRAVLVRV